MIRPDAPQGAYYRACLLQKESYSRLVMAGFQSRAARPIPTFQATRLSHCAPSARKLANIRPRPHECLALARMSVGQRLNHVVSAEPLVLVPTGPLVGKQIPCRCRWIVPSTHNALPRQQIVASSEIRRPDRVGKTRPSRFVRVTRQKRPLPPSAPLVSAPPASERLGREQPRW